ncbi:MAG: hypothetical protein L0J57_00070 [Brachybacterium sp.]|nr:hypothetical protein [Brachybacterium sp.]
MENIDNEELATRAIQQARRFTLQAEMAAKVATDQAVALLHASGRSQREIARLTGLSKSDVARRTRRPALRGPLLNATGDHRVYAFADEWIWGSPEAAQFVADELRPHGGADLVWEGGPSRSLTPEETERETERAMERTGDEAQQLRRRVRSEPNPEPPKQCVGGVCGHCEQCVAALERRDRTRPA